MPDAAERSGNFGQLCSRVNGTFDAAGICSNPAGQIYDPYTGRPDAQNNATGRAPIQFNNLATYSVCVPAWQGGYGRSMGRPVDAGVGGLKALPQAVEVGSKAEWLAGFVP